MLSPWNLSCVDDRRGAREKERMDSLIARAAATTECGAMDRDQHQSVEPSGRTFMVRNSSTKSAAS